ncbi:MAG: LapA family protein [Synergistaceae bacterium]|jgi:uncharacterized membrane protein YciS (DUF1049 family)|nr:LapA family protein [Synergistaceae bacterium]
MIIYLLVMAVSVLVSAIYSIQNPTDITVRFIVFERTFRQGLWEAGIFSAGVVLMWLFSLIARFSIYSKSRKEIKECNKRILQLEDEKKSLMEVLKQQSPQTDASTASLPLNIGTPEEKTGGDFADGLEPEAESKLDSEFHPEQKETDAE